MNKYQELVVIYKAPNMIAANMVRGILENQNIPVTIRSLQISMYDDIALMHNEVWGELLVPQKFQKEALKLIKDYCDNIED